MSTRLNEEAEQFGQHMEKGADRLLKGAALLSLAGLIGDKSIEGGQNLIAEGGQNLIALAILGYSVKGAGVISAAYLAFIGLFTFFSGAHTYEWIFRLQNLSEIQQKYYRLVYCTVLCLLFLGWLFSRSL